MFDRKELQKKVEEQEQRQKNQEPAHQEPDEVDTEYDERANRLRDIVQSDSKWDTSGLKPNTRRKKIGITLLVVGLVGYLLLQYVLKGS